MGLAKQVKRFTPQEYYALERDADYKSDFYAGEIFAMAGGTVQHSLISANLTREVGQQLKDKPCRVFESNLRVAVKATGLRCYPDVSVFCGPLEYDDEDPQHETLTNPIVIFEVLSKSTEGFDRGLKSESYRRIPSLQSYLLVRQDAQELRFWSVNPTGRGCCARQQGWRRRWKSALCKSRCRSLRFMHKWILRGRVRISPDYSQRRINRR